MTDAHTPFRHLNLSRISSSWGLFSLRDMMPLRSSTRPRPHRLNSSLHSFRNVSVLLFSPDGRKLFLVKLRRTDKYTPPGGRINHGEKPFDAIKREFREETGMELPECHDLHGYKGFSQYISTRFSTKFYIGICPTTSVRWRSSSDGETNGSDWKSLHEILVERRHRIRDCALGSLTEFLEELLNR